MMRVFLFVGIELFDPFVCSRDHFSGIALAELDPRAVANAIDGRFQVFEQRGNRLAGDGDGFLQRPILGGQAIDTAVYVVAIRPGWVKEFKEG